MSEDISHNDNPLDLLLHALANPLRRELIERLAERDINVGELSEGAGVSMPSISRHLAVLEKAGMIVRLKRGRNHMISLRSGPLGLLTSWYGKISGVENAQAAEAQALPYEQTADFGSEPVPAEHISPLLDETSDPPEADSLDLSPDSLSDLVKRLKRS
ncbi:MAG TPA: ArsR family transcriptional regulator [Bacteroidetes bacterium]|nr:transcriptional repressor SdpR [bacterium BMS3Bbin04]HDO66387.1 ArsR family transcriptional regulator [Bacteroidota bacterium]HEX05512.1 ArsR family transcriptional regulator [Bacteroidota bacterium]